MIFFYIILKSISKQASKKTRRQEDMLPIELDTEFIGLIDSAIEHAEQLALEQVSCLDITNVDAKYQKYKSNPFRSKAADKSAKEVLKIKKRILEDMNSLAKDLIKRRRA